MQKYPLDISVAQGRARVRTLYHHYANYFSNLPSEPPATKLAAMNAALLKGTQELIEIHNRWSQKTHVMRWFEGAGEANSPARLAAETDKQVKRINEDIAGRKVTPFLEKFLTK